MLHQIAMGLSQVTPPGEAQKSGKKKKSTKRLKEKTTAKIVFSLEAWM